MVTTTNPWPWERRGEGNWLALWNVGCKYLKPDLGEACVTAAFLATNFDDLGWD